MKAHSTAANTQSTVERMLKVARDNPQITPAALAARFGLSVFTVRRRLTEHGIAVMHGRSESTPRRR